MNPIVTIAIPTLRNYAQLEGCLYSLLVNTEFPYRIVIINNDGWEDGKKIVEQIAQKFRFEMEVIHAGANLGWMGAINVALESCKTPFFCMMNDDVLFLPYYRDFWRRLLTHFNDPQVGAVGPSSNYVMGAQSIFQLIPDMMLDTTLLIGFCMMLPTELFKQIGGLDESLPGGDDLDLSIRLRKVGYKLRIDRSVFLYHIGQQTGARVNTAWNSPKFSENTNNAIIKKHGVKEWYDTYAGSWSPAFKEGNHALKDLEGQWYKEKMAFHQGQKIINLGCGNSTNRGWGLDIRRPGEQGAGGQKFFAAAPDIVGDATSIPAQDNTIDCVMAAHILEHLIDPFAVIQEWKRVLKPGGMMYLTAPNHEQLPTMILDYTHLHAYTPSSIQNLLNQTGWEIESIEPSLNGALAIIARKPAGNGKTQDSMLLE